MKLDTKNWQPFKVGDLFYKLENGKANQTMLEEGEDCFYVGAKRSENGVMFRCAYNDALIQKGNCIIFICNGEGSVGYANYMSMDFIGTTDIVAGYNKNLNEYTGPFIATVASLERPKFSYGRKWKKFLKNTELYLPVDGSGNPDWPFMENYIKSLYSKPVTTKNSPSAQTKLVRDNFAEFVVGDLIDDIYKGKAINKDELTEAGCNDIGIRYITRTAEDNGCELLAKLDEVPVAFIEKGNAISIGDTTATCFYQDEQFIVGDHMVVIRAKWLNKYSGLYITTLLNREQYKYSYGRAFVMDKIKNTVLKLPVTPEGEPNWQFMENYIKSLPYGDRI